jgi:hypothetical protein
MSRGKYKPFKKYTTPAYLNSQKLMPITKNSSIKE